MHLEGVFSVARQADDVRSFLADLNKVGPCVPDLQQIEVASPERATVKVKAGLGFLKGIITIRLQSGHEGDQIQFRGQGSGMGSAVDIHASFIVDSVAEGAQVRWQGEAKVRGTLASLGGGLLDSVTKQNVQNLIGRIESALSA